MLVEKGSIYPFRVDVVHHESLRQVCRTGNYFEVMHEFEKSRELAMALWEPKPEMRVQCFTFCFHKSRLLTIGRNVPKTHPLNRLNASRDNQHLIAKSTCSELSAVLKLKRMSNTPFHKITFVNVRIDRNRQIKNSCPCDFCRSLLDYCSPRVIYHTTDNGDFVEYNP